MIIIKNLFINDDFKNLQILVLSDKFLEIFEYLQFSLKKKCYDKKLSIRYEPKILQKRKNVIDFLKI